MVPFFFLTSERLKKGKKRVLFSKSFYTCHLIHPHNCLWWWGRAGVIVPILQMKESPKVLLV